MFRSLAFPARLLAALLIALLSVGLLPSQAFAAGETLTVTPQNGPGGATNVTFVGTAWPTGRTTAVGSGIEISFDGQIVARCATGNNGPTAGKFTTCTPSPVTVPNVDPGLYNFTAADPLDTGKTATAPFTVAPTVSVSPGTGLGGTTTSVSGNGFRSSSNIEVLFDGVQRTTTPDPCVTNSAGSFTGCQITVPFGAGGSKTILVRDVAGTGTQRQATTNYTLQLTVGTVALGSTTGPWGSTVAITGSNWPASRTTSVGSGIEIQFGGDVLSRCATTAQGALTGCSITIPDTTLGAYTVRATDPLNSEFNTSTATNGQYTITGPAITLGNSSGQAGANLTISGAGFRPSSDVELLFDGVVRTPTAPCATTATGTFSCQITVPGSTGGEKTVLARDLPSGELQRSASKPYTVNLTLGTLTLNPTSGPTGTTVTVTGSSWTGGRTVDNGTAISFDGQVVTTCATGSNGSLSSCSFKVPALLGGTYTVAATDGANAFNTVSSSFTVNPGAITLTPSSGGSGSNTTVSGHGFRANSTVEVLFGGTPVTTTAPCTTDAWGTLAGCQFVVPAATAGAKTVLVRDLPSGAGQRAAQATYSVIITGTLTLSATSGAAGTTITATGTGWAPSRTTSNGTVLSMSGEQLTVCATTSVGALDSCTFRVPPQAGGLRVVDAVDGVNQFNTSSRSFTILAASLSVTPGTGGTGSSSAATGSGFRANSSVRIEFDGTLVQTCTADEWGAFSACQFTVPGAATKGIKTVIARDLPDGGLQRTAQTTYDLTTNIELVPSKGVTGSQFTVAGDGFNTTQTVEIRWGATATVIGTCSTTATGALSGCVVNVPLGATTGSYSVAAVVTTGNPSTSRRSASATYTVVHPTAVTVEPASGTYGDTVALTATLSSPGGGISGQTITFKLNNVTAGTAVTDGSGVATLPTASLTGITATGSPYPTGVLATYAGDATHAAVTNTAALTVTPREVTGSFTVGDKQYDGTTTATISGRTLSNAVAGDAVSLTGGTAEFDTAAVGTGKTVSATGFTLSGAQAANYTLASSSLQTTAAITKRALTASFTVAGRAYDGTTAGTINSGTLTGALVGDVVTLVGGTATFDTKNVGAGKTVTISGYSLDGANAADYSVNPTATATATITPRALVVTANGVAKEYDATTSAVVSLSTDKFSLDTVNATYSGASFANKNVGENKTVTVSGIAISGADAGNYALSGAPVQATASITRRALTVSATGSNKTYDGTPQAQIALSDNRLNSDVLTPAFTSATFNNKNVGNGKLITVSGISISGTDAGNYTVNSSATTTGNITRRDISVLANAASKIYDGSAAATVTLSDTRLSGDDLTPVFTSALFPDRNAGFNRVVTVSGIGLTGPDAGNYNLITPTATDFAHINVRPLAVGAAAQNKVYDGTTGATISLSVSNRVAGDAVTPLYTSALFGSAATGTGKTVTVNGISLTGADAANYSSNTSTSTTASITQRQLTVTASATDKVYDGATAATVALSDNRLSGDAFSVAHTAAVFNSKNVGAGKQVTVSGISISGTDAANYTLASTSASTNASISARPITITAVASSKTYDGTPTASVTLSDNRVSGDVLTRSFSSATFANENVGTGKPVTVAGLSLSGTDAANYSLTSTSAGTAADITPRALLVTAHGVDRTYDGSGIAGITLTDNRVAGDALTASYGSATFVTKNVGTNKTVSVTGIAISGTDAANYTVNSTATTAANVIQRALTATASAQTKRYDGTTAATVTMGDNRVSGDVLTVAHDAAEFDSAAVGNNRVVTVSGIHLIGTDAANYTVNQTAQTTASIIAANGILVTFTAASKVYDGSTATVVMGTPDLNGVQAGDDVSLTGGTVTFDTKDTGINKTVTWNGFALTGADAANYELPETFATTTANITPAALTVTADDKDMVWGQAAPTFTSAYAGFIAGETPADLTGTLAHTVKNGGGTVVTVNQTTPAGTYRIVPSGQTSTNYSITYVDGDLNVGFIAGSGTYRPDGKVSLSKASGYSGNGVYNTTGAGQTKSVKVARGKSRTFYIQVQNDGDDLDTFTLKNVGTPKGGVSIQYFDGATRVTRQLMLGTYRIVGAGAGTTRSLRVVMTVGSRARVGATSLCGVRVTSAARPELTDTVKTAVTATR